MDLEIQRYNIYNSNTTKREKKVQSYIVVTFLDDFEIKPEIDSDKIYVISLEQILRK